MKRLGDFNNNFDVARASLLQQPNNGHKEEKEEKEKKEKRKERVRKRERE
jgi:hypothetical protein